MGIKKLAITTPLQLIALPAMVVEGGLIFLARNATGTNLTILIVGMLVILTYVVVAGFLLARTPPPALSASAAVAKDVRKIRPEGTYLAEGNLNYRVEIRHLAGDVYEVSNPEWHGAGVMVGLEYYGIFIHNEKAPAQRRNLAGAHICTYDPKTHVFEGRRIEFSSDEGSYHQWTLKD